MTAAPRARSAQPVEPPSPRALPIGAVLVVVISFAIVLAGLSMWPTRDEQPAPEPSHNATPSAPAAAPPAPVASAPPSDSTSERESAPVVTSVSADVPKIVEARLCTNLSTGGEWRCDPVSGPVAAGPIFFYTRIASSGPMKVQHRWYIGDRLRQNVTLDIQSNSAGYRTYSRTTIKPDQADQWRVELRTQDGQLLREERFTVGPAR